MKTNRFRALGLASVLLAAGVSLPLPAAESRPRPGRETAPREPAAKVDLNTADAKALAAVTAIGPELAAAIVAARPFKSVDELSRVQGISAERLEQIRARVRISSVSDRAGLGEPTMKKRPLGAIDPARTEPTGRIDLNTAGVEALAAVPAIGPDLAPAIVAARPFKSTDDLSRLEGISAERLEQIRRAVSVAPTEPAADAKPGRSKRP